MFYLFEINIKKILFNNFYNSIYYFVNGYFIRYDKLSFHYNLFIILSNFSKVTRSIEIINLPPSVKVALGDK